MSDYHFGYLKNSHVCEKGCHYGCGDILPENRAARAARMRDTMPDLIPEVMKKFIADWELHHGKVIYRMDNIGVNEGHFVKSNKGQNISGPVYVYPDPKT